TVVIITPRAALLLTKCINLNHLEPQTEKIEPASGVPHPLTWVVFAKPSRRRRTSMTWLQRYRLRHFLRFSFWIVPTGSILAALLAARAVRWLSDQPGWSWFDFSEAGAQGILDSLASSMLTFIVFALSALLLAVQLASGQLTSRIIAIV